MIYQHLDSAQRQIRLLKVLPSIDGEGESTFRCEQSGHPFDGPQLESNAMSYAWGELLGHQEIVVDDVRIPVTENLREP
jgi:hypothetical protein